MSFITSKDYLKKDYRYYFYKPLQQENTVKTKYEPDEDELNRFENSDLIEVTPTGKVNAYGYPIKNYKVKWNRSQKAEWNRLERRHK